MAEFPIFPLKVADLLVDTYHMDTAEFGAYVRILLTMWQVGGRLDEDALQKTAGLSRHKWQSSREKICRPLTIIDGIVSQKRLEDTRLKVRAKRAKAAVSAKRRWGREVPCVRIANVVRLHPPQSCERIAIKTKKVSKSPFSALSQSAPEPPEVAFDEASKGHPLRARLL